jgi:hypothetical protein
MRGASAVAVAVAIAIGLATETEVDLSAHRKDEYLQAARLAIQPDRVELQLDLTPGIVVADRIIADIDRDGDGVLTAEEQHAYVARVRNAIALTVDDSRPLNLQLQQADTSVRFPDVDAFRSGEGSIHLRFDAALPRLSNGAHRISYRNTHVPEIGAYLSNALVPDSDRVAITSQRRDVDQHELTVEYDLHGGLPASAQAWLLGGFASAALLAAIMLRRYERRAALARDPHAARRGPRVPTAARACICVEASWRVK